MTYLQAAMASASLMLWPGPGHPGQVTGWTWTLYEGEGPLVLANEMPDTPQLRTTFECTRGSGVARLSVYGGPLGGGFASVTSGPGAASAQVQAEPGRDGKLSLAVRTDHPVFGQFLTTGDLAVTIGGQRQAVTVETAHLAKLRRFADLCGG
ncbi:MAG TPA: hypothetical protein VF633_06475 [Brevundimonas sp.]|jgi:hypothetical protein